MSRDILRNHKAKQTVYDYPTGTVAEAGYLVSDSSGWRMEKPVLDIQACRGCLKCYLVCPDGCVIRDRNKVKIERDFCKGCGICSVECRFGAIKMERER